MQESDSDNEQTWSQIENMEEAMAPAMSGDCPLLGTLIALVIILMY